MTNLRGCPPRSVASPRPSGVCERGPHTLGVEPIRGLALACALRVVCVRVAPEWFAAIAASVREARDRPVAVTTADHAQEALEAAGAGTLTVVDHDEY